MHLRFLALPAVAGLALAACGSSNNTTGGGGSSSTSTPTPTATTAACVSGSITASGSTALQPLVAKAATLYQAKCPGATVTVSGGGSSTGLSNVASGTSDIGDSDVPVSNAHSIDASTVNDNQVAIVVFGVIVNPGTGVTALTTQQIVDIFTGKVTNWSSVGGKNVPVTLIERKPGSGTRLSFDKIMLGGGTEAANPASTQDSTQLVLQGVAGAPGGVSYVNVASAGSTVTAVSIDGNAPTAANVTAGKYTLFSHEHMYVKSSGAAPLATAFIDYILSDEFQTGQVSALGYLPIATTKEQSAADQ